MAARILGAHAIPGPPRRSLAGYRGYLRALDREPLGYLQGQFEAHGAASALVAGDARMVFALGSAANQQLMSNPHLRRPHPGDLTQPGAASAMLQQLSAAELREAEVRLLALAWQKALLKTQAGSEYAAAAVHFTEQMVERWGVGQQLDLVYVLRRLNLRLLLHSLLGVDTTDDVESRLLLHHWINSLATPAPLLTQLPGLARRRDRRVLARVMTAIASAGPDQFLPTHFYDGAETESGASTMADVQRMIHLVNVVEGPLTGALTWTLLLLSQHQRVLSDIRAELRAAPAGGATAANQLGLEDAPLPLLERVIKESLRLLPPRALGLRETTAPSELLGYAVPQNAAVVFSPLLTHRLASLFVTPRRFRPERWLYIEPTSAEYLPLGPAAGSSLSFGFLLLHLKLVLATLLGRSRLVLAAGARVDYRLHPVLLPKGELPMIVAPLERQLPRREVRGTVCNIVDFGPP